MATPGGPRPRRRLQPLPAEVRSRSPGAQPPGGAPAPSGHQTKGASAKAAGSRQGHVPDWLESARESLKTLLGWDWFSKIHLKAQELVFYQNAWKATRELERTATSPPPRSWTPTRGASPSASAHVSADRPGEGARSPHGPNPTAR